MARMLLPDERGEESHCHIRNLPCPIETTDQSVKRSTKKILAGLARKYKHKLVVHGSRGENSKRRFQWTPCLAKATPPL